MSLHTHALPLTPALDPCQVFAKRTIALYPGLPARWSAAAQVITLTPPPCVAVLNEARPCSCVDCAPQALLPLVCTWLAALLPAQQLWVFVSYEQWRHVGAAALAMLKSAYTRLEWWVVASCSIEVQRAVARTAPLSQPHVAAYAHCCADAHAPAAAAARMAQFSVTAAHLLGAELYASPVHALGLARVRMPMVRTARAELKEPPKHWEELGPMSDRELLATLVQTHPTLRCNLMLYPAGPEPLLRPVVTRPEAAMILRLALYAIRKEVMSAACAFPLGRCRAACIARSAFWRERVLGTNSFLNELSENDAMCLLERKWASPSALK